TLAVQPETLPETDLVTLTSASTAQGLAACLTAGPRSRIKAVSIGPITTQAAQAAGLAVVAQSPDPSMDSLTRTIAEYFSSGSGRA
ncbi:MAG: uroporphyrinogen-III synthase, partial [Deltaproteobacteria bacterium]|nr:uroporphyrinogen-III synthase [Deltaproteobacteria bacterium]